MPKLRVATWNLDHASNSSRPRDRQISQILKFAPDILVLTETCEQVDLQQHGYQVVYPNTKNMYGKYWSSIWFNHKAILLKEIKTANDEVAVCATFKTALGKINVYGTIIAYRDFRVKSGSKPWEEHYKSIKWHGQDWSGIVDSESDVPLIVAGDFNQTRDGSNRYSSPEGIDLLSKELDRDKLICLTEENFGMSGKLSVDPKKGLARANIDHICISAGYFQNIEVGAWDHFSEDGAYMSDHNAVFVDLT